MSHPEPLAPRAVPATLWSALAQTGRQVMTVAAVAVLARLLSPSDFGLVAMVTAITAFLEVVSELGLSAAAIQRRDLAPAQSQALFWINALFGLTLWLLTAAASPLLAWFYHRSELVMLAAILGAGFLLAGLGVQPRAMLTRDLRLRTLAGIDLTAWLIANAAAVIAAFSHLGVWALVIQILGAQGLQTLGAWLFLPWRPALPRRADVRSLLHFGSHLIGFNVLNYFARNLDNVIIGRTRGSAALGFYSRAYQLLTYPISAIGAPLSGIMLATLSRLQDDLPRFQAAYLRAARAMVTVAFPIIALMAALREEIVLTLYGSQWAAAVPIFGVLALAAFQQPVGNSCGWIYLAAGRPDRQLRWGLVAVPVICLGFLIGAHWGAIGVATGYAIAMAVITYPMARYAYATIDLGPWQVWRHFAAQFASALLAGAVAIAFRLVVQPYPPLFRLLLCTLLGSAAYLAALTLLWRGWWPELRSILSLIRSGDTGSPSP